MKASKVAQTTARRIFRLCTQNGEINEDHLRVAMVRLATDKPRDYRGILQTLKRLVRSKLAEKQVKVESATPLDPETAGKVQSSLREKYGQDLVFEFFVNPELLGGMKVRVGNDVFDGSVKSRLERLENSL